MDAILGSGPTSRSRGGDESERVGCGTFLKSESKAASVTL